MGAAIKLKAQESWLIKILDCSQCPKLCLFLESYPHHISLFQCQTVHSVQYLFVIIYPQHLSLFKCQTAHNVQNYACLLNYIPSILAYFNVRLSTVFKLTLICNYVSQASQLIKMLDCSQCSKLCLFVKLYPQHISLFQCQTVHSVQTDTYL